LLAWLGSCPLCNTLREMLVQHSLKMFVQRFVKNIENHQYKILRRITVVRASLRVCYL
jgi:hypothetical protein